MNIYNALCSDPTTTGGHEVKCTNRPPVDWRRRGINSNPNNNNEQISSSQVGNTVRAKNISTHNQIQDESQAQETATQEKQE